MLRKKKEKKLVMYMVRSNLVCVWQCDMSSRITTNDHVKLEAALYGFLVFTSISSRDAIRKVQP